MPPVTLIVVSLSACQVALLLRIAVPVPARFPVRNKPPLKLLVPANVSTEVTVTCSFENTDATLAVGFRTVITKFPAGLSMITVSPSPGTTPPLQLDATSQKPSASTFQETTLETRTGFSSFAGDSESSSAATGAASANTPSELA